jgi:hypothetical protein
MGSAGADGARALEPLLRGDERGGTAALARAVELVDDRAPPLDHLALGLGRARRRGVQHPTQALAREAVAHLPGQSQQPGEVGGHGVVVGDPVLVDQRQRLLAVPLAAQDQRRPAGERDEAHRQRTRVVERRVAQDHAVDRCLVQRHQELQAALALDHVAARRERRGAHPLRSTGGARRVEHRRAGDEPLGLVGAGGGEQLVVVGEALDGSAERDAHADAGPLRRRQRGCPRTRRPRRSRWPRSSRARTRPRPPRSAS